jgi:ribulose-phosphate 3-epimerase
MKKKISPSLMCGRISEYKEILKEFEKCGIEYLHIDVMDGEFVPNLQFGTDMIKQIRKMSNIPLDIHLMINNPEDKLEWFGICEGEYVAIHYEATKHVQRALAKVRELGAKPMLALNPATPLCVLEDLLPDVDAVLIMTVNPGFAGQKIVPATIDKVKRLRKMLDEKGYENVEIEVDGNVSFENARLLSDAGANIFVAGTSSVFHKDYSIPSAIEKTKFSIR